MLQPVEWDAGRVRVLDQRLLPHEERWLVLSRWEEVAEAIRTMRVRGAPAIGIAAAYALALAAQERPDLEHLQRVADALRRTRPTAVNLAWALDRMLARLRSLPHASSQDVHRVLVEEAHRIHREDIEANRKIGDLGAALLPSRARVLTLCNTGALATGGYGTALGILRSAWAQGKLQMVYACETRPVLQGARLTAWELLREGIPFRLIVDAAAGALLAQGRVDAVVVGADRIARNGDTANKIGTYTLAVLAARHGVPLYVAAPSSTVDLSASSGAAIPIEERDEAEVLMVQGHPVAPSGARAWNPAFDVTPHELIAAIITERGVLRPPYEVTLPQALA